MASLKAVNQAIGGLTSQLRWFASAAATAERRDLEEATLARYEQLNARLSAVDTLFARFNEVILDLDLETLGQAARDKVVADYDQMLNLSNKYARQGNFEESGPCPGQNRDLCCCRPWTFG